MTKRGAAPSPDRHRPRHPASRPRCRPRRGSRPRPPPFEALPRHLREGGGRLAARRLVHDVAGPGHRLADRRRPLDGAGQPSATPPEQLDPLELGAVGLRLVGGEAVRAEQEALGDGPHGVGLLGSVGDHLGQRGGHRGDVGADPRGPGEAGGRPPKHGQVQPVALPEPDQHRGPGRDPPGHRDEHGLAGLGLEARLGQDARHVAAERGVERLAAGAEVAAGEHRDGEEVGFGALHGGGGDGDGRGHGVLRFAGVRMVSGGSRPGSRAARAVGRPGTLRYRRATGGIRPPASARVQMRSESRFR